MFRIEDKQRHLKEETTLELIIVIEMWNTMLKPNFVFIFVSKGESIPLSTDKYLLVKQGIHTIETKQNVKNYIKNCRDISIDRV